MRLAPYLCVGGNEVANDARSSAIAAELNVPGMVFSQECACWVYDEGDYTSLNSPWYEPTRPESADLIGFYASNMNLQSVASRPVSQSWGAGGTIGPLRLSTRNLLAQGLLVASTAEGMAYGERWLMEVLRGSPCADGGCAPDDLTIMPACPADEDYETGQQAYRTLVGAGLVDGPIFQPLNVSECIVQQVSFILTSSMPWLYLPADRCLDAAELTGTLACSLTTPEWMGEGTFVIDITNTDSTPTTDIVIEGQISLDGSCPVTGDGTSVMPSFRYVIPTLGPEDRIVIDGMRRKVTYTDASEKYAKSGLAYVDFEGPWIWPDVGICTTMCVTITGSGGDAVVTTDTLLREL